MKRKSCTLRMGYTIHDPEVDARIKRVATTKSDKQLKREREEAEQNERITALLRQAREAAQS